MNSTFRLALALFAVLGIPVLKSAGAAPDFAKEVAPLFTKYCAAVTTILTAKGSFRSLRMTPCSKGANTEPSSRLAKLMPAGCCV
jgi:hypothetical protein